MYQPRVYAQRRVYAAQTSNHATLIGALVLLVTSTLALFI
jgi:hypothetical protein